MRIPMIATIALTLTMSVIACAADEPEKREVLCRGNYQSEAEACEQLARFGRSYADLSGWKDRGKRIREGVLHGARLLPPPAKCALKPILRDKRQYDDYSVENVAFESLPGFFVTGNLYRPQPGGAQQRQAAILCPHGHSKDRNRGGRFGDDIPSVPGRTNSSQSTLGCR